MTARKIKVDFTGTDRYRAIGQKLAKDVSVAGSGDNPQFFAQEAAMRYAQAFLGVKNSRTGQRPKTKPTYRSEGIIAMRTARMGGMTFKAFLDSAEEGIECTGSDDDADKNLLTIECLSDTDDSLYIIRCDAVPDNAEQGKQIPLKTLLRWWTDAGKPPSVADPHSF